MRRSTLSLAAAGVALIMLAFVIWLALARGPAMAPAGGEDCAPAHPVEAGTQELTLELLLGGQPTLQDLHGDVVLLNIWATWCPPCRERLPALEAVHRRIATNASPCSR